MKKDVIKIGDKLRQLRIERGHSQSFVSFELGMAQGTYCKLENDQMFPTWLVLQRLTELYNISLTSILSGDSKPTVSSAINKQVETQLELSKDKFIALQERQIELLEQKIIFLEDKLLMK